MFLCFSIILKFCRLLNESFRLLSSKGFYQEIIVNHFSQMNFTNSTNKSTLLYFTNFTNSLYLKIRDFPLQSGFKQTKNMDPEGKHVFNSFITEVSIIQNPLHGFAELILSIALSLYFTIEHSYFIVLKFWHGLFLLKSHFHSIIFLFAS